MKIRKLRERISVFVVKKPDQAILFGILLLNIALFLVAAFVISALSPRSLENSGFWPSVFYTISMILDAGCISFVVADIGESSVALIIACLLTVVIGMITFTGAVIGYVTNMISNFIENSKTGERALKVSGHTVILNWNSRASEIINDLLYTGRRETVVILVSDGADTVKRQINDRIADTLRQEGMKNRLDIIVREGDTVSSKQLSDISLLQARNVIILGKDVQDYVCKYDYSDRMEKLEKGNANTIKTLVQVAEITSSNESADNQVIVVEVEDEGTMKLVEKVIAHKERLGKCNIIPIAVNKILGQILSQFSIMPELNTVYSELFSNRGAEFFCRPFEKGDDEYRELSAYFADHYEAIPMTTMQTKSGEMAFYIAENETDDGREGVLKDGEMALTVNWGYCLEKRNIIIIGHNSNCDEIMNGFNAFRAEWNQDFRDVYGEDEILNILVIDDKKSLEKHDYYRRFPYVSGCVEAEVFDDERICETIRNFVDGNKGDTSILILSDDNAPQEDVDANSLTYLIYVQSVISEKTEKDPRFKRTSIDVIVEILDPKNFDVAHNFSANNVVISNRYISKMVTQISEKESLFEFYQDILTYDEEEDAQEREFSSKELYIKKVSGFLESIPGECSAAQLIRAVYHASDPDNRAIVIGYVDRTETMHLFPGDQNNIRIRLSNEDKLIVFSNH